MARKKNLELEKNIINNLKKHSQGTYISEIARNLGLQKSTVSYIINTRIKDRVEDVIKGPKGLFKIIKLKSG